MEKTYNFLIFSISFNKRFARLRYKNGMAAVDRIKKGSETAKTIPTKNKVALVSIKNTIPEKSFNNFATKKYFRIKLNAF